MGIKKTETKKFRFSCGFEIKRRKPGGLQVYLLKRINCVDPVLGCFDTRKLKAHKSGLCFFYSQSLRKAKTFDAYGNKKNRN